jgi:hypothetical protein
MHKEQTVGYHISSKLHAITIHDQLMRCLRLFRTDIPVSTALHFDLVQEGVVLP